MDGFKYVCMCVTLCICVNGSCAHVPVNLMVMKHDVLHHSETHLFLDII